MQLRFGRILLFLALVCALIPTLAFAQAQIVGQVRDESGGVLPGVTVEAASPAIIEKVRTAMTDDQGRFRIEALRPGVYKLTFTLVGFSTVVRDGIDVPSAVVVTVNADLKVGALEETVTVSGDAPQVDVTQASRTQVITRDIIDTLPISRNVMSIGVLSPGVRQGTPDIGGSRMTEQVNLRAHGLGGNDAEQLVEGMSIQSLEGASQAYFDDMLQSEITIMTSAIPADTSGGGIRMNSVLKDGGNTWSGATFLGFSSGEWQANNTDDELRAAPRSIASGNAIKHIHMFTGSLGGPIMKDKMWMILTARHQSSDEIIADTPVQITAPDGEVINSYLDTYVRGPSLRLTYQLNQKNKVASFVQRWWKRKGKDFAGGGQDPRASQMRDPRHAHHTVGNVRWTSPMTNKLLFEAGYSWTLFDWLGEPMAGIQKERDSPEWYTQTRKTDTQRQIHPQCAYATGCTIWGSNQIQRQDNTRHVFQATASYVTGSHNVKIGYNHEIGPDGRMGNTHNGDLYQNYVAGRPSTVTVWNTPLEAPGIVDYDAGLYLQDSWTIKRLTINPGIRAEFFSAGMREASSPAGRFVPARFFPEQRGLIKWGPDWAPRLAAVYDLFGNGRTALKTNYSRYYRQYDADPATAYSPIGLVSENRNWFDCLLNAAGTACSGAAAATNNDGIVQDIEIGPSPAGGSFGKVSSNIKGDLERQYNWEFTAGVQHQLMPRLAVGAMLYKRQIKNIQYTDRSFISTEDYTAFQTAMPADVLRDPDVAAVIDPNALITVYNLNAAKNSVYGVNLIDQSSNQNLSLYTGSEVSFSARLAGGALLFGSWTAEKNVSVFCESNDNPNGPTTADLYQGRLVAQGGRFCDQRKFGVPFTHEFKLAGNYGLPGGVDFGAVVQSFGGLERVITWQPAATLYPNGQRTQAQTIILNEPGSLYGERWNQVDINFKKNLRYGNKMHTFQIDFFNVFNNNAIRTMTDTVGASLGQVTAILPGRFPRIGYQFKF
ncbi:MAG: TonB-dependent receptor [Vicinamibacterales bacterium]|nr:TonB-dependent receptor [Vicinamibacterales bacterium]